MLSLLVIEVYSKFVLYITLQCRKIDTTENVELFKKIKLLYFVVHILFFEADVFHD